MTLYKDRKPVAHLHWLEDGEEHSMEFYAITGPLGLIEMQQHLKKEGHASWTCYTSTAAKIVS